MPTGTWQRFLASKKAVVAGTVRGHPHQVTDQLVQRVLATCVLERALLFGRLVLAWPAAEH